MVASDIWAKVIWGDIGNPAQLATDLKEEYNIELKDLLNMRTFLDHNRIWEPPVITESSKKVVLTGAYKQQRIVVAK